MKRNSIKVSALIFIALGGYGCVNKNLVLQPPSEEVAAPASGPASVDVVCGSARVPISVSSKVPNHLDIPAGAVKDKQCVFDAFSWNSFIALAHSQDDTLSGRPVWQDWPQSSDIFREGGVDPGPWPGHREIPSVCGDSRSIAELDGFQLISQLGKHPGVLSSTDEPFDSGPLVDTNGFYSRFMIAVNKDMYNEIRAQRLYSKAGQEAYSKAGKKVNFGCGCAAGTKCSPDGQQGSLMVKAAWKILHPEKDDASQFHTTQALVYTPSIGDKEETCTKQEMGLVGFHIAHKIQDRPQWVWSTFEHERNAPIAGEDIQAGEHFNYYQPDCNDCSEINVPPPRPWNPHIQPVEDNSSKSQVKRVVTISESAQESAKKNNSLARGLLAGTVWTNYKLISTQWPVHPNSPDPNQRQKPDKSNGWCTEINPAKNLGSPTQKSLANTTLETYIQGEVSEATSSCIGCHLNATMAAGQNNFSDFTYLLERAQ